jgi:hypothetical protein
MVAERREVPAVLAEERIVHEAQLDRRSCPSDSLVRVSQQRVALGHEDGRELALQCVAQERAVCQRPRFVPGKRALEKPVNVLFRVEPAGSGSVFDVADNGRRFLVNTNVSRAESMPVTVVAGWRSHLTR